MQTEHRGRERLITHEHVDQPTSERTEDAVLLLAATGDPDYDWDPAEVIEADREDTISR